MKATFQFLGTGASAGVPVIGCSCKVCHSKDPKDQRYRPSGILRIQDLVIAVDMGPDFRSQALRFGVEKLDGLILTHTHYDHIAGIDEVRIFNVRQKKALPCLLSKESLKEIEKRYHYFFDHQGLSAKFEFLPLEKDEGTANFLGLECGYCSYFQSKMKVNGFRFGNFAYVSDIQEVDASIFPMLKGVKTLVLSSLRPEGSEFHLSFEEASLIARAVEAENTYLTHLGHFSTHEEMRALLPEKMEPAYDGLILDFGFG